jgi:acetaldehyde dehydrogenase/alcohol dehydrogenase
MAYRAFITPRHIYYGPGALQALTLVEGQRALIVTDPGVRGCGTVGRVEQVLASKNIKSTVFDQVTPDPPWETVVAAASLAAEFKPDLIIGVGGGSSMDAGKTAWLLYENPDMVKLPFLDFLREVPRRELRKKARYVAISTTSGTGSEVTSAAVVTDRSVTPPFKAGFGSRHLVPDVAIADPELASSMPPDVTANSGYDALVHATECYVLTQPSDLVDPLAIWSAKTIFDWLARACTHGDDMQARDKMHTAALQAGLAFSNGRLGIVHGLAHQIGGTFFIPHGRANAFMLCQCFAFLYPTHKARLASMAALLGITGKDERTRVSNLLIDLDNLKKKVGIPLSIKDSGLEKKRFDGMLDAISEDYLAQMARSPYISRMGQDERRQAGIPLSVDQVKELFLQAWNGTRAPLE